MYRELGTYGVDDLDITLLLRRDFYSLGDGLTVKDYATPFCISYHLLHLLFAPSPQ
jgi:hypothetical protein